MNGGLCTAFTIAANVGSSSDAPVTASSSFVGSASVSARRTRRRRVDRVIVERERPIDAVEQLVDDALHLAGRGRLGSEPCTSVMVMTGARLHRFTRRRRRRAALPTYGTRAGCRARRATRTIRQPHATPYATAAERSVAAVVDVAREQLADEPLVRSRQQQRVAEVGVHRRLAQQHRALRGRLAEIEAGVEHDLLGQRGRPLRPAARARAGRR